MKPGLYKDMPAEKYHRLPFAAQSSLKILRDQTPAHLRYRLDHPYEFETPAMRFGTLVHTAVLEPDRFDATHVRGIEGDGRKKEIKEAREELAKSGKTVVDPADFDLCMQIRDAVRNHRMARLLFDGESERSAIWKDAETGVLCKGRFDHVSEVSGVLVDLKTTTDASPAGFERSV
jgi:exodeoxyribonuclease VIII